MHFVSTEAQRSPLVPGRSTTEHVMMWHSRSFITTPANPSDDILSFLGAGEVNMMGWHEDVAYESFSDPSKSLLAVRSALCGGGAGAPPLSRPAWEAFRELTLVVADTLQREFGSRVDEHGAMVYTPSVNATTGKTEPPAQSDFHVYKVGSVLRRGDDPSKWFTPVHEDGTGPLLSHLMPVEPGVFPEVPDSWVCSCDAHRVLYNTAKASVCPAPPLAPAPIVGFVIPRGAIRVGELIASGGMGEVWQGKVYNMEVVLKKVKEVDRKGRRLSDDVLARRETGLRKEAAVMERIQVAPHDNIATYYGCTAAAEAEVPDEAPTTEGKEEEGEGAKEEEPNADASCLWVAMEGVKSVYLSHPFSSTLHDWLVKGDPSNDGAPWPLSSCRAVAMQICQGLQHLHTHGYLHLDVKPGNVLLTRTGADGWAVKVADLGLCMTRNEEGQWVSGRQGTKGYMAPELSGLRRGEKAVVSESADVYSLGRLLQRGLLWRREVSDAVEEMMDGCVEVNAESRPSMAEVLGVLRGWDVSDM